MAQTNILEKIPQRLIESLPYTIPLVLIPFPANFMVVGAVAAIITGVQVANNDRSLNLAGRVSNITHGTGFYFTAKGIEQFARTLFSSSFLGAFARGSLGLTSLGIGVVTLIAAEIFSQAIR